jgi:hypothetical protein
LKNKKQALTDDIVDELKFQGLYEHKGTELGQICLNAAQEIERLREIVNASPQTTDPNLRQWWANLPS